MMDIEVNSILSPSKASKQEGVNSKGISFARRSQRG